jgi:hypothetical protein
LNSNIIIQTLTLGTDTKYNAMLLKRIIAWLLFLPIILGFIYMGIANLYESYELLIAPFVFGMVLSFSWLITLYTENKKIRKVFKYLFISLLPIFLLGIFAGIFLQEIIPPFVEPLVIITSIVTVISALYLILAYNKTDIFIFILIILSVIGLIFKSFHWPGTGIFIVIGWSAPAVLMMCLVFKKITEYDQRTNRFLGFFKTFICMTLSICFVGLTFKTMHWLGGGTFNNIGLPLSVLAILFVVFLLPGSNFIEWTREHKRMFYLGLLIPLIYLTTFTSVANVFPETMSALIGQKSKKLSTSFILNPYDIPVKDGLEPKNSTEKNIPPI